MPERQRRLCRLGEDSRVHPDNRPLRLFVKLSDTELPVSVLYAIPPVSDTSAVPEYVRRMSSERHKEVLLRNEFPSGRTI